MKSDAGRFYGWLYDKGTAAGLVFLSGLLLAVGQTRTIVDAVGLVHPGWSNAWAWVVAVGFETAILSVGLVMASTGDRDLWRWEIVLVGASVLAGLAVGMHGHTLSDYAALIRAGAMGLLPVQYLAVVLTGHKLAKAADARSGAVQLTDPGAASYLAIKSMAMGPATSYKIRTQTRETGDEQWADIPGADVVQTVRRGRPPGPSRRGELAALLETVPIQLSAADRERWLGDRLGVAPRTVRRWLADSG